MLLHTYTATFSQLGQISEGGGQARTVGAAASVGLLRSPDPSDGASPTGAVAVSVAVTAAAGAGRGAAAGGDWLLDDGGCPPA